MPWDFVQFLRVASAKLCGGVALVYNTTPVSFTGGFMQPQTYAPSLLLKTLASQDNFSSFEQMSNKSAATQRTICPGNAHAPIFIWNR